MRQHITHSYIILGILLFSILELPIAYSQQLANANAFEGTSFIWNPALVGKSDQWEVGSFYQNEWIGFEDAPFMSGITFEYPFQKENMSIGAYFSNDNQSPIIFNTLGFSYAYHLILNDGQSGKISLGLNGHIQHFFIDGLNIVVNEADDDYLPRGEHNGFGVNASAGIYYQSKNISAFEGHYIFGGVGFLQLLPSKVQFDMLSGIRPEFRKAIHSNALLGYHFVKGNLFIEPTIWLDYSLSKIYNGRVKLKLEKRDAFWTSVQYRTDQSMLIQLGVIVNKGFVERGSLRIGTQADFNLGNFGNARGMSYGFYGAYRMATKSRR